VLYRLDDLHLRRCVCFGTGVATRELNAVCVLTLHNGVDVCVLTGCPCSQAWLGWGMMQQPAICVGLFWPAVAAF
jgi:hypothetical protein